MGVHIGLPFLFRLDASFDRNHTADPAANGEPPRYSHPAWIADPAQLIKQSVGNGFIENSFVAEAVVIKLERFQLNTFFIRDVFQLNGCEVGHPRNRADRSEFWRGVVDHIIPVRGGIGERFQN